MKMKKYISLILAFLIMVSGFLVIPVFSKDLNDTIIYSEKATVKSGENVTVPIYIKGNTGLVSIKVILNYDETKLAPKSVVFTDVFNYETRDSNIGSDKAIPGQLEIIGYNDDVISPCSANGMMFYVEFETIANYVGEASISIKNDEYFTYDENYEYLKLNPLNPQTTIINITEGDTMLLYSDTVKGNYNDVVTIPIKIKNNKGLYQFRFNFKYDESQVRPISCEKVIWPGWFGGNIDEENQQYFCMGENGTNSQNVTEDGELFKIKFKILTSEEVTSVIYISSEPNTVISLQGISRNPVCEDIKLFLNHTPVVTNLTLKSKPNKMTYELFEEFDNTGMVIEATKDDGSVETITDYTVTGFETNSVGTKTVNITYNGMSVSFDIEVAHNHTWGEWQNISSPNCLDKGSEKRVCSVCKDFEMRDVDPLGHNWEKDFTVDIEPKCEIAGSKSIHCSRCDAVKDITPIDPIGHDYESSITKAATCTENGINTFVCKNDPSHTHTEEIPKLNHNYVVSVTKQPTCEEKGIKTFVCSNDPSHTYTEGIPAIGHNFELTKTIKPTCTEDGKEIYTCKNDFSHTKEVVLKATGHTPSDWITDKAPTYLEDGVMHRECTKCKTVLETKTLSILDDVTAPEIEIKVENNSFKTFIKNITFGLFFKENVDINIIAEDSESGIEKIEYIKTNTPINESDIVNHTEWISGEKLTVSDEEEFIIYAKAIDKHGNISYAGTDGLVIDKTAPTISGITDNAVYCGEVSFTVSDKHFDKVIINSATVLPENGKYTLIPSNEVYNIIAVDKAGNETTYNVTVNSGHTFGAWITDEPADCTNEGTKHRICSICGHREDDVIDALDHDYSDEFTVDIEPTCTTDGEKSKHCLRCDDRKDVTVIPATGHTFGKWKTIVSPDCTNSGSRQRVCTTCGFTETENLNPKGHNWNSDYTVDIPATCTTAGSKSIHCADCNAVNDSQVIPAKGHNIGEYEIIKQATCEKSGIEKRTCSDCDYLETREIAALGHDYAEEFTIDRASTCTEKGEKSRHCSRCDSRSDITIIPATGHNYGEWTVATAPTCTEKGRQQRICSDCDNIEVRELAAAGHSWNDGYTVDIEPGCITEGNKSIHCANCNTTKDSVIIPAIGHSGGKANCHNGAICDVCGNEYGDIDVDNHIGETEIRGYIAPTKDNYGYSGDTYCKSCGVVLERGIQLDKLPGETIKPTPEESSEPTVPADKSEQSTQETESSTENNTGSLIPDTGTAIALGTVITIVLICILTIAVFVIVFIQVNKKKKEN